jgi:hypothetical protein
MIPAIVRHLFLFSFDLTEAAIDNRKVYRCRYCGTWTDDPERIAAIQICSQRNRRQSQRRSSGRRRETDKNLRLQACALAGVENGIPGDSQNDSRDGKETSAGTSVLPAM